MPSVGFLESHAEGIQVLVHHVQQREGVNDGLILTLFVKLNIVSSESVTDTEVGAGDSSFGNMLLLANHLRRRGRLRGGL